MLKSSRKISFTFLGTGTSQGVPVIACDCEVCLSQNTKDKRMRTSGMLTIEDKNIVFDAGPDFRRQMLDNHVKTLEAILFTHEHKDHIAGLDDVRAYNYRSKKPMKIFCTDQVFEALKREYHYVFDDKFNYPGIPQIIRESVSKVSSFKVFNELFVPVEVMHYKLPVLGFRFENFAYLTDANLISLEEKEKLENLDVLVVNALRKEKHISHFNLEEALDLIEELKPKRAYLTHISHLMGLHTEVSKELPENVFMAYDSLKIDL